MSVLERMQEPTPKFFKVLRTIGLSLVAAGGVLVAAPIALPAVVLTIAGYVTVAGTVMTAVSQTAVEKQEK
jgi:ABC-type long-subunit fatty acid transport system fused permease/ATPase subunit